MILAVALMLLQFPAPGGATAPQSGANQTVVAEANAGPVGKLMDAKATTDNSSKSNLQPVKSSSEPPDQPMSSVFLPPPPVFRPPEEAPVTHWRLWILLSASAHSSAGFDAWSTRRALASGRIEADPMMRPFAGSAAILRRHSGDTGQSGLCCTQIPAQLWLDAPHLVGAAIGGNGNIPLQRFL